MCEKSQEVHDMSETQKVVSFLLRQKASNALESDWKTLKPFIIF